MQKRFKFWCKGTSPNENFQQPGWWTFPFYILEKHYRGLEIFNCPHFEVCQWTGLLDVNGREIYEGDIVHLYLWTRNLENSKREVIWEDGGFPLFCDSEWSQRPEDVKVIGNKFENPDLLCK